ncbi:hypothetical protein BDQ17DRAFT_1378815 [Cyathus striatus]|nr:hypothetical protein BDQ17DRAFT_1378815 [Cyathus striatus]
MLRGVLIVIDGFLCLRLPPAIGLQLFPAVRCLASWLRAMPPFHIGLRLRCRLRRGLYAYLALRGYALMCNDFNASWGVICDWCCSSSDFRSRFCLSRKGRRRWITWLMLGVRLYG